MSKKHWAKFDVPKHMHPRKVEEYLHEVKEELKAFIPEAKWLITTNQVEITDLTDYEENGEENLSDIPETANVKKNDYSLSSQVLRQLSLIMQGESRTPWGVRDVRYGPFQEQFIDTVSSDRQVAAISTARQIGVTFMMRITALAIATTVRGSTLFFYSDRLHTSRSTSDDMMDFIIRNGFTNCVKKNSKERIEFDNGSQIRFLSQNSVIRQSKGIILRGPTYLLIDNASHWSERNFDAVFSNLHPLFAPNNEFRKIILAGTGGGPNKLFAKTIITGRLFGLKGGMRAETFKLNWRDAAFIGESVKHMHGTKKVIGSASFDREYELLGEYF